VAKFSVFLIIIFAVYDQLKIMRNQKRHVMSKNVVFTISKRRVN